MALSNGATPAEKVRLLAGLVATEACQVSDTSLDFVFWVAQVSLSLANQPLATTTATRTEKIRLLAGLVATEGSHFSDIDSDLILEVLGSGNPTEQPMAPATTTQAVQVTSSEAQTDSATDNSTESQVVLNANASRKATKRPAEDAGHADPPSKKIN